MTILDTFFILFESDTSKLDKGLTESEKKAKTLTEKLGLVDKEAEKVGLKMGAALATMAGAALATVGLAAMSSAMFEASEHADKLNESAERLGINIETISAWGDLIKKNGGSVDGFIASIEGLNSQLQQMEVTGKSRAAPFLKELGIDLELAANKGKNALDFLPQIADAFEGMDKQKSVALGKRLGFDQATIMTLQAGGRALDELIAKERELGVVTKQQGEIADAFGDQMDDTRHAFRSVWLSVSEYVLPPLTWMLEKFQDVALFLREHSHFIVGLMVVIGTAIATYVIPPLLSMAATTLVAFAPFILAGALVSALGVALALVYEDIMTFIEGGDSMIGAILNKWPVIGAVARGITDAFGALFDAGMSLAQFFSKIWDNPTQAFMNFFNMIWDGVSKLMNAIPGLGSVLGALGIGQNMLGQAASTPMASQTSTSISNTTRGGRSTSVQIGTVAVQTQATDAQGISKAIGGTMRDQMRQASSNFDDGVLA